MMDERRTILEERGATFHTLVDDFPDIAKSLEAVGGADEGDFD